MTFPEDGHMAMRATIIHTLNSLHAGGGTFLHVIKFKMEATAQGVKNLKMSNQLPVSIVAELLCSNLISLNKMSLIQVFGG